MFHNCNLKMSIKRTLKRFIQNKGREEDVSNMEQMLADGTISDINIQDNKYGDVTALMYQAEYGTKEAMMWLLIHDPPAAVNLQDSSGRTALTGAIEANSIEKIRLLLEYGADRKAPLQYARALKKDKEVIYILETYFPENNARRLERERALRLKREREKQLAKEKVSISEAVLIKKEDMNYEVYESNKNTDVLFKYLDVCDQNTKKLSAQSFRFFELEKHRLTQQINKAAHAMAEGPRRPSGGREWNTMSSLSNPPPAIVISTKLRSGASRKDIPCIFYFRDGPCRFGDACQFSHTVRVPV